MSTSGRKAQLHVRIDQDTKDWLIRYAQSQGREQGEIVQAKLQELREENETDADQLEEKRLERQLVDVEKTLEGLEDENKKKYVEGRALAAALKEAYRELGSKDWRLIKARALRDFQENPDIPWVSEFRVKSPLEILAACRIAMDLDRLREVRRTLTAELGAKLGVKLNVDSQPPGERQEPIDQPTQEADRGPAPPRLDIAIPRAREPAKKTEESSPDDDSWGDDESDVDGEWGEDEDAA